MPVDPTPEDYPKIGDFYEDAFYHPCLCTYVNYKDDEISGISLVDGSIPRCASMHHGFVRKLTVEEAIHYRYFGPLDAKLDSDKDWTKDIMVDAIAEKCRLNKPAEQGSAHQSTTAP